MTSDVSSDLLTNQGIALEVAESIVRAIHYSDNKFGIGFFTDGEVNEVSVQLAGGLKEAGEVRDKLQQVVANGILNAVQRIQNKPKASWKDLVDEFHKFFYYPVGDYRGMNEIKWFGRLMMKNPMDLMVYQEIIHEQTPDVIIETGSAYGASALYMAQLCDLVGNGRVISIDKFMPEGIDSMPEHERLEFWLNDSVKPELVNVIKTEVGKLSVMVLLDSDHSKAHVLKELDSYAPLVTKGQYLIVEDTDINGHPVSPDFGDGPFEAVQEWLPSHPEFEVDKKREHFIFTQNPGGYLRKIA